MVPMVSIVVSLGKPHFAQVKRSCVAGGSGWPSVLAPPIEVVRNGNSLGALRVLLKVCKLSFGQRK